ncbi:hypothetical protein [Paenibacillus sp. NPDC093718]|uniref:hypothetical protein n=1 Tax=Paenibacillus sp. NPDC093718 TaxID=3390601 RepID=UPI003D0702BF
MKKTMFLMLAVVLIVISYMPLFLGGYVYNEEQAMRRFHPAYTGDKLYERTGDHHKLIVWHDGNVKMVTVMENKWGLLHRASNSVVLERGSEDEPFTRIWSASHRGEGMYDTLLAVETPENESRRIIVTNEPWDDEPIDDLDQIKALSGIYIEMDVEQGYALHYEQLPADQIGGFIFRSIDSEGNILSVQP